MAKGYHLKYNYPGVWGTRSAMSSVLHEVKMGNIEKWKYITQFVPDGVFTPTEALDAIKEGIRFRLNEVKDHKNWKLGFDEMTRERKELESLKIALDERKPFVSYKGNRLPVYY